MNFYLNQTLFLILGKTKKFSSYSYEFISMGNVTRVDQNKGS